MSKKIINISVIVPVHNTEKYVKECIESILKQTFNQIEIICIDSSTDGTPAILKDIALRDNRVIYVGDHNSSYGYKVNVGIKTARGKYIAIADPDDYMEIDMLERLYFAALENQVDFVKSDHMRFGVENGKNVLQQYVKDAYRPYFYGRVFSAKERPEILCLSNPAIWSGLYKKEFLIKNQIFMHESEGASFQDAGFSVLTHVLAESIYYLNQSYYRYRVDNENSSVKSQYKYKAVVEECNWIDEQLKQRKVNDLAILNAVKIRKINTYYWNFERLNAEWRKRFCDEIHKELVENFVKDCSTEQWRTITKQRLQVLLTGNICELNQK